MDVTIVRHIIRAIRLHLRGTNEKIRLARKTEFPDPKSTGF